MKIRLLPFSIAALLVAVSVASAELGSPSEVGRQLRRIPASEQTCAKWVDGLLAEVTGRARTTTPTYFAYKCVSIMETNT
jgi:hypothetical protein